MEDEVENEYSHRKRDVEEGEETPEICILAEKTAEDAIKEHYEKRYKKKKSLSEMINKKLSGKQEGYKDFAQEKEEGCRKITVDDSKKCHGDLSKVIINVSM